MQFGAVADKERDEDGGAGGEEDEAEERGAAEGGVTVRPGLAGGGWQPPRAQHGEGRHQLAPARALAPGPACSIAPFRQVQNFSLTFKAVPIAG